MYVCDVDGGMEKMVGNRELIVFNLYIRCSNISYARIYLE